MKYIITLILGSALLLGHSAEALFEDHCVSCHSKKTISFKELKQHKSRHKAPPINLVSARLKQVISISVEDEDAKKAVITAFIKDYVRSPSIDKGLCRAGCFAQFGEMPKLKKNLSNEDLDKLASWIYDTY